jgi:hypothetical protein
MSFFIVSGDLLPTDAATILATISSQGFSLFIQQLVLIVAGIGRCFVATGWTQLSSLAILN